MFVIEDEWHAEWIGEYVSREEAHAELRRLAELPWDEAPNVCPCISWQTCGRRYHIIELDTSAEPWRRLHDEALLDVSAERTAWLQVSERGNAD
jgi:thymidylate synthase ThyX